MLKSFDIFRFRIFEKKTEIEFKNYSALVGANSAGKTTICDALKIFFDKLYEHRTENSSEIALPNILDIDSRTSYQPGRDYPVNAKQGRRWPTTFSATFELPVFQESAGGTSSTKTKHVVLNLVWDYDSSDFVFVKSAKDPKSQRTSKALLEEIANSINFLYIPAARNQSTLNAILEDLFHKLIESKVQNHRKIGKLKRDLFDAFNPSIREIERQIEQQVFRLEPNVRSVNFHWEMDFAPRATLDKVVVDDGIPTPLKLKGDGLKNIFQIVQFMQLVESTKNTVLPHYFFAIEEPECHLNSRLLHRLKNSLVSLGHQNQVIVTTHSPVFTSSCDLENILLLNRGDVSRPTSRKQIAEHLGIRAAENLIANDYCLLVEGKSDEQIVKKFFKEQHPHLLPKLDIVSCGGAKNAVHLSRYYTQFHECVFVLLDNDQIGAEVAQEIRGFAPNTKIYVTPTIGRNRQSELEDLVETSTISRVVSDLFNMEISEKELILLRKKHNGKFSSWIEGALSEIGVPSPKSELIKAHMKAEVFDNQPSREFLRPEGMKFLARIASEINSDIYAKVGKDAA